MRKLKELREFKDLLGSLVLRAPDNLRYSFLSEAEQPTLDSEFIRLREGLELLPKKLKNSPLLCEIERLLDEALAAYKGGERLKGAHLLQDIEDIVNPGRFVEYAARKGIPL